jgi:hypothetical protein
MANGKRTDFGREILGMVVYLVYHRKDCNALSDNQILHFGKVKSEK